MICHIHGCGPSIEHFTPDGNYIIGCNDSWRYWACHQLVVVSTLSAERAQIVEDARPEKLLSGMARWSQHPSYEYIGQLHPWRQDRENRLDKGLIYYSNNTPFICSVIAFNLGFSEIVLWGVDFTNHRHIRDTPLEDAKRDFAQLNQEVSKRNCSLYLGISGSVLPLPQWK